MYGVTLILVLAVVGGVIAVIGDRLGIDLYYVALLAFGFRMFKNLAMLRRYLLRDYRGGGHKSMLRNP